jgi:hypothetical protein
VQGKSKGEIGFFILTINHLQNGKPGLILCQPTSQKNKSEENQPRKNLAQ